MRGLMVAMNIRGHRAYEQFAKIEMKMRQGKQLNDEYLESLDKDALVELCEALLSENMNHTLKEYQVKMVSNYTIDELIEMFVEGWCLKK